MKRTGLHKDRCVDKLFLGIFDQCSAATARTVLVSFLFIGLMFILKIGLSQASQEAKVQSSNPPASLKTIIVNDYFPYTFVNDNGIPDGFSVDIAKAVAEVMDLKLEISEGTWENAIKALANGTIDFLPMMAASPERAKHFDFSVPHTIAYDAIFLKTETPRISSLKDLGNKTVILMNKDAAHDYLLSTGMAARMKLVFVDSLPDALRTLAVGKGDAALMPKLVGLIIMKKLQLTNLDPSPVVIDGYNRPFSFAVKDGNQVLLERLSQGLSIIKTTGRYQEIYQKWFGALEPKGLPWLTVIKYIAGLIAIFSLIALGLFLWTVSLRKQVALRTEKIEAEIQERRKTEEALCVSEERYRSLVETQTDLICRFTPDGTFIFVNDAYCHFYEKSKEELVGKKWQPLPVDEDISIVEERLLTLSPTNPTVIIENRIWSGKGDVHWFQFVNRGFFDPQGDLVEIQSVGRDITERKQGEEERDKLQGQLLQAHKMESIGRLAGGVAHDFNNLLTAIIGNAEMALMDEDKEGAKAEVLGEILKAGEKAGGLTRQLLAFSRKQVLQPEVVNLNEVVSGTEKILHRLIGEDIELITILTPDLDLVEADVGQIEQVIMNLAVNARDAMSGGGKLTIETANVELNEQYAANHVALETGPYVLLSVSDNGIGITPEVQDQIFEPFFTTKEKGKGTGLGLATVYGIVKQSRGNIWVYSEPGQGTTFKIYLPRLDKSFEEVKRQGPKAEFRGGSETILLVEDEEGVRNLAFKILERFGYQVLIAKDGQEATEIFERHGGLIDLLLTDVVMPRMSGRELAEKLEGLQPSIKVLFMSGYTNNVIAHHGILDEGIAFIQKPFTSEDLVRKVRGVLDS